MARKPNLDNYVEVKDRIPLFYAEHPEGRIVTEVEHLDPPLIVMKATLYRDHEPTTVPLATGFAYEKEGEGYVNKTSYIENCETSAIGRALANAGFTGPEGAPRPSREEMEKVARMQDSNAKAPTELVNKVRGLMDLAAKDDMLDESQATRVEEALLSGDTKRIERALDWLRSRTAHGNTEEVKA